MRVLMPNKYRGVLDQSGILGYWSLFLGYWDIASLKLGYWDIHEKFGILGYWPRALWGIDYWSFEHGILVLWIWDIGILALWNWDILDTMTPSNTHYTCTRSSNSILRQCVCVCLSAGSWMKKNYSLLCTNVNLKTVHGCIVISCSLLYGRGAGTHVRKG